jgi:hypothetical protein
MGLFLIFEASQPCGRVYRLGLVCFVPANLASMVVALTRLFC